MTEMTFAYADDVATVTDSVDYIRKDVIRWNE